MQTDTNLYATSAVIVRVVGDGSVQNYMTIAGTNPISTKVSQDECWGITPNTDGTFAAVLTIKMTELRDNTKGDFKDVLLIIFSSSGTVKRATVFTLGNIQQSMLLSINALVIKDD